MEQTNNGKFILDAPSSTVIASNAHFIAEFKSDVIFNHLSYAIFTSLLGKIEIENLISENFMNIKRGETVISTLEGKFLPLDTFRNQQFIEQTLKDLDNSSLILLYSGVFFEGLFFQCNMVCLDRRSHLDFARDPGDLGFVFVFLNFIVFLFFSMF